MSASEWPEKDYRLAVKAAYARVEQKYSEMDPDVLEVEPGLGTLMLQSPKAKIILSTQPSVRQLWLAAAHIGRAVHFDYDPSRAQWLDDKNQGLELFAFLEDCVRSLIQKG